MAAYPKDQWDWLRDNYHSYSKEDLAENFNKKFSHSVSPDGLRRMCNKKGMSKQYHHVFTKEQDKWLLDNYGTCKITSLVEPFNKLFSTNLKYHSIQGRIYILTQERTNTRYRQLTDEELAWLLEPSNTYSLSIREITEIFNRLFSPSVNEHFIRFKMETLGIPRTFDNKRLINRKESMFTKEHDEWLLENIDFNEPYPKLAIRFNEHFGTDFKHFSIQAHCKKKLKINKPHSGGIEDKLVPIGHERYCKHHDAIYIKTEDGWRLKHVYIWEKHNGPIPKGCFVIPLDGNRQNCDINNLCLVTNKVLSSAIWAFRLGEKWNDRDPVVKKAQIEYSKLHIELLDYGINTDEY